MIRAALYIRVSTQEQKLHGLSLDAQKAALEDYAKSNAMQIVDVYADEGITARKRLDKRKEFQRLLADIQNDKIDLVLVTKLDRWFRNIKDYHVVQAILEKHNCNWRTIFESYDTSTSGGRLHINIMLSVNQDECDRTSERIKAVFERKLEKGEYTSGSVPMGYMLQEKRLVKNPEEENIVMELFEHFEKHQTKRGAITYVNEKYGLTISIQSFTRMIRNTLYKGEYKGKMEFCEAYIDADRWANLNHIGDHGNIKTCRNRIYTYSGLIPCPVCGNILIGSAKKNRDKIHKQYRCNNHYLRNACSYGSTIAEIKLNNAVSKILKQELQNYRASFTVQQKKDDNEKRRESIKRKMKNLKTLFINELINLEEYKEDLKAFQEQLDAIPTPVNTRNNIEAVEKLLAMDIDTLFMQLTPEEKRTLLRSVVKRVHVTKDYRVNLEFF